MDEQEHAGKRMSALQVNTYTCHHEGSLAVGQ